MTCDSKLYTNLFQAVIRYPFDKIKSLRYSVGVRTDKIGLRPNGESAYIRVIHFDTLALKSDYVDKQVFLVNHIEYVFDNTIIKTINIMNGLRYKFYIDFNYQINTADKRVKEERCSISDLMPEIIIRFTEFYLGRARGR